ncbi:MAG: helix-turn-helix transcriptional regulator [Saprospirales bacterium]|nr:helix-turn-helix transcriptional regulator [Saprospirales bacterium]
MSIQQRHMQNLDASVIQQNLFRYILAQVGPKAAIPAICEALHINKSSVYNRLNGSKRIDLDELARLVNAFSIPLEELLLPEFRSGLFRLNTVGRPFRSGREHLEQVLANFNHFSRAAGFRLWLCTDELLYFQCMHFRELALFKLFTYASINWQLPYTTALKFDPDHFPERDVYDSLMAPILNQYNRIPTVEIWSEGIYNNILKQIAYFEESGQIAGGGVAGILYEQLEQLCAHQFEMASEGCKWAFSPRKTNARAPGGIFDLYYNSMAPTGITLLADSQLLQAVFLVFDDPNFMFVGDTRFFQYTQNWMTNLRKKCVKISQDAEGARRQYFEHIRAGIRLSRNDG